MKHILFSLYYLFLIGPWIASAFAGKSQADLSGSAGLFIICWYIAWYWLPTMVSFHRNTRNAQTLALINLLTGWTGIGWLVAFVMAILGRRH